MTILLVFLILITPVQLILLLDGAFTVDLRLWGLGRCFRPHLPASSTPESNRHRLKLLLAFLRAKELHRFLRRHIHLNSLQVLLHLGLADAACTAVYTGLLRHLAGLLPAPADVRIQPDFLRSTHVQARCILSFRLGTLFIAAGMLAAAWIKANRKIPAPKEA